MRNAGYMLLVSATLHALGFVVGGFAMPFLLFPVVVYLALFFGLTQGKLWAAWIGVICMLGGITGTIVELIGTSLVPIWALWGILAADIAALLFLSVAIRSRLLSP